MRESAVTESEGTPRSLEPTQLLFINSCCRSVCSCVQERRSQFVFRTIFMHLQTRTSETPKLKPFASYYLLI